jgi:heme A synthase
MDWRCRPSREWINVIHRGIVLIVGLLVVALVLKAWRTQRSQTPIWSP